MQITIALNGVDVSGLALDATFKTRNTEQLSIIVARLIGQMAEAGMVMDDGQLAPDELTAIWEKQNDVLTQQMAYLEDVGAFFQKKHEKMPQQSNWLGEALKQLAAWLAARAVIAATVEYLGPLAELAGELTYTGVVYAIDALSKVCAKGILLCDSMMAENHALLALTPSRKNYELRSLIISQHDQTVGNLLAQAAQLDTQIREQPMGDDAEWQDWMANMDEALADIETFLDDGIDAEVSMLDDDLSNNLPVPIAPKLPTVPFPKLPSRRNELAAIIIAQIIKVGGRALLKYLKKQLDRKNVGRSNDLIEALKALKYNEEEVETGGIRILHRNKVLETV